MPAAKLQPVASRGRRAPIGVVPQKRIRWNPLKPAGTRTIAERKWRSLTVCAVLLLREKIVV
jgi:hypothetical protein